jgi:predicted 2-oxoglutarate/Fe(II)-dependent dioxygenase YbiX
MIAAVPDKSPETRPFGLLRIDDFLDPPSCGAVVDEMRAAPHEAASVSGQGVEAGTVDESQRRARTVEVPAATSTRIWARLVDVRPALEEHFDLTLGEPEPPQFLTYRPGGFQVPHHDAESASTGPDRLITVVLFLNDRSEALEGDGYSGGSLVLYGLLGPSSIEHGFPVGGNRGQLVAFRADMLHEVKPVTTGLRHTVVGWFPPGAVAG